MRTKMSLHVPFFRLPFFELLRSHVTNWSVLSWPAIKEEFRMGGGPKELLEEAHTGLTQRDRQSFTPTANLDSPVKPASMFLDCGWVSGEQSQRYRENVRFHTEGPLPLAQGFKAWIFLLWTHGAKHCNHCASPVCSQFYIICQCYSYTLHP